MNPLKALIVDDEPLAQDIIETYIEKIPSVELVSKCSNVIEANELIQNMDIDLLFLDIQMPQITGIDFVKSLKNPPMIIFTTAYPEYAVEGFELEAIDYLLKPISLDRFMKAVNRAVDLSQHDLSTQSDDDFFFVKADKKLIKIHYDEILYIEGLKDYVIIKKESGRVITLQTMKSLDEKLPSDSFLRIHRSFILNISKIKALIGNMVEILEEGKNKHLPIGKNYRDALLEIVKGKRL